MEDKNLEEYYNECIKLCDKIKNPILRDCCKEIYVDYKEKLINKPATDTHHYYKGGLLYHIYSVTKGAIAICNLYSNLEVDMDLIIFGALLHDIGKTKDFNDFSEDENYNLKTGNSSDLLGHSYEGTHIVENYLSKYDIDEQFKNQVIHMIGSHMNEYSEWGAFAHNIIKNAKQGELYKIGNAPRPYYKSLNPYYNKLNENNK